jgi:hypothetical protein
MLDAFMICAAFDSMIFGDSVNLSPAITTRPPMMPATVNDNFRIKEC